MMWESSYQLCRQYFEGSLFAGHWAEWEDALTLQSLLHCLGHAAEVSDSQITRTTGPEQAK